MIFLLFKRVYKQTATLGQITESGSVYFLRDRIGTGISKELDAQFSFYNSWYDCVNIPVTGEEVD
jgi:hypothetical protein